jgi:hypothetical protein
MPGAVSLRIGRIAWLFSFPLMAAVLKSEAQSESRSLKHSEFKLTIRAGTVIRHV